MRILKILIETNLFVSLAAVAFLWANILLLGFPHQHLYFLTLQVFFSTWFIYQVSRWIYFKKGAYTNTEELVVKWFEKYPVLTQSTIFLSGILTIVFTFLLKWETIRLLIFIGGISVLYPIPFLKPFGIKTRLRDFPFLKIFLIAIVWSVTSVLLPATEAGISLSERKDVYLMLATQFIFILFITLPFDINDMELDKTTSIKTIPGVFGLKTSKIICMLLGILCGALTLFVYMLENWRSGMNIYIMERTIILLWLLLLLLQLFTFIRADKVNKWIIKVVYDGSMIVYFLIVFFTIK
ncbi:MAG: hypothetical protein JWN78_3381 [Bacteroidota bacterium]|nr:hypothetical protein [Bacteroidota bacterium]